jgi:nucleoside-diphosphate-sugar epimerase
MEEQMKALVTGAAGFIGSHLSERLLKDGYEVTGIDCFTDYYSKEIKEKNLSGLTGRKGFKLVQENLLSADLERLLDGTDLVFHEAAQPGVRASWGKSFSVYVEDNILATQRLLESLKGKKIKKMLFASSSSIYGDSEKLPTKESFVPKPVSPYGVTKLAAESLCYLYSKNHDIPVVSLRYFTVYGPRQRPDMGFNRFIKAIIKGDEITVYGNGEQTRDFTFVTDIVEANIKAANCSCPPGEVFNIGGGSTISVNETIRLLEGISGKKAKIKYLDVQKGDVAHTAADISKAKAAFSYSPKVDVKTGLTKEYEWLSSL